MGHLIGTPWCEQHGTVIGPMETLKDDVLIMRSTGYPVLLQSTKQLLRIFLYVYGDMC